MSSKVEAIEVEANAIPSIGQCELYAWAGELESIAWPREDEIDIIEFTSHEEGKVFRLIVSFPVVLFAKVPVEVSFSFWDSVDKELLPMGGRTIELDEEIVTEATITFDVKDQGTESEEIALVDVEISTKNYEVDLGEIDVFEPEDYCPDCEEPVVE